MVTAEHTQFEEHLQALLALGHSRDTICQRLLLSEVEFDREVRRSGRTASSTCCGGEPRTTAAHAPSRN